MTNSSSRSDGRRRALVGAAAALTPAAAAAAFLSPWAAAGAALLAGACAAASLLRRAAPARPDAPAEARDAAAAELAEAARRVTALLDGAFRGDLESRVTPTPATEPARALAVAANDFLDVTDAFVRESRASLENVAAGRYHRRFLSRGLDGAQARAARVITEPTIAMGAKGARFRQLTGAFEAEVVTVAAKLGDSASGLRETAAQLAAAVAGMGRDATEIDGRAGAVADSAAEAAEAATRMETAVAAVSERTRASRDMAGKAAAEAEATAAAIRALLDGAARIGTAVELIHSVSEQTNLLAVNAMIEAARSGREGAGFAVVAREVQALAGQTKDATRRIETEVRAALAAARGTAAAVEGIRVTLAEMTRFAADTATDAEGQRAAVGAIVGAIGGVSADAATMSRLVGGVAGAVAEVSAGSDAVRFAADGVLDRAETLGAELKDYLRAASAA